MSGPPHELAVRGREFAEDLRAEGGPGLSGADTRRYFGCVPSSDYYEGTPPALDSAAQAAHEIALLAERPTYLDPSTGYVVFTSLALAARGYCCGNGCRHCPYGPDEQRRAGRPGSWPPDAG